MKYSIRTLFTLLGLWGLLVISILTEAHASIPVKSINVSPYFGVDAGVQHLKWANGFGSNLYKKNHAQGSLFGGITFCDYVGIEGGYETTPFDESRSTLTSDQLLYGNSIAPLEPPITVRSFFQIKGWYLTLLGLLPISCEYNTQLFAGVGVSRARIYQTSLITATTGQIINPVGHLFNGDTPQRTFVATKGVLRLTAGLQSMLCDCIGVRAFFNWYNTARFKSIVAREPQESTLDKVKVRNSFSYGLGLFVKF